MQNRFSRIIEDMKGLINQEIGSAPVFLLAVSGGIDSMCMTDLFSRVCGVGEFAIAHCNFRLRGEESDGDEALVRRWAAEHSVNCHVEAFDTEEYARLHGLSIEMAARELRYSWFARLCKEHGYHAVVVAHNANDNAETLMLNLLRGAGVDGLSGMSAVSELPYSEEDFKVPLLRPLLQFTRKQIEGHVFANRIGYRNDSTNFSSDYKRNRIRNEVFPVFEKVNPSFIRTLNKDMEYFGDAAEIVGEWCASVASSVVSVSEEGASGTRIVIALSALLSYKHWRYLLYYILKPYGFNSATLASIENLLQSPRTLSGKTFRSESHSLLTGRDRLTVLPLRTSVSEPIMAVRAAGKYHFNGRVFKVEEFDKPANMPLKQPHGVLVMDADKLAFPFVLRRWRSGDWLVPLGMSGKKKVSDMFTDLKYDVFAKENAIIIVDTRTPGLAEKQHVAAVAGVRMDDRYKVTSSTRRIIRISCED